VTDPAAMFSLAHAGLGRFSGIPRSQRHEYVKIVV
jgi:hypothetical protein